MSYIFPVTKFNYGDHVISLEDLGLLKSVPKGTRGVVACVTVTTIPGNASKTINWVDFLIKGQHVMLEVGDSDIALYVNNYRLPYTYQGSSVQDLAQSDDQLKSKKPELKCECGAHSTGSNKHSSWCEMNGVST